VLLENRVALVMGAGQTPGATIGNGRATSLLFGREGATVVAVDRDLAAAEETSRQIADAGGRAVALQADATGEQSVAEAIADCVDRFGRIDILHNNVGVSLAAGDASVVDVSSEAFDNVIRLNLKSALLSTKHVLPVMRAQRSGVITYISSIAAITDYPNIGYKTAKAGVIALMQNVALTNAPWGIRANAILPGLINTPMAIEPRVGRDGLSREEVIAHRDAQIPLGGRMGSAWDIANAAVFLASDNASFITGVALPVDGGQTLKVG
jgi:NAD(P)-dependent dehydrogenase (short-subunit alcohol dehydrogenase family)